MTSEISLFRHNLHGSISSGAYERLSGPGNREFEHKFPKKIQMPGRGARRGCRGGGGGVELSVWRIQKLVIFQKFQTDKCVENCPTLT